LNELEKLNRETAGRIYDIADSSFKKAGALRLSVTREEYLNKYASPSINTNVSHSAFFAGKGSIKAGEPIEL